MTCAVCGQPATRKWGEAWCDSCFFDMLGNNHQDPA